MKNNLKHSFLLGVCILLASCSTQISRQRTNTPPVVLSSPSSQDVSIDIGLADNGKTFTFKFASRFFIFLDDTLYPVSELRCSPVGIIGYISNGSLRGPGFYPVMFEGVTAGRCTLSDRDFQVEIVIK